MKRALIQSGWIGTGTARDPYRPQLHDDFASILHWSDASALPVATIAAGGATGTLEVVCADATLAAIQAHPRYAGRVTEVSLG